MFAAAKPSESPGAFASDERAKPLVQERGAAVPYFGHIAGSAVAGLAMAGFIRIYVKAGGFAHRASAWDTFVTELIQDRWVVITLKTGDAYAGFVRLADVGVVAGERDVVLREPARHDGKSGQYQAVGYRDLFVQAPLVDSMATLMSDDDKSATIPSEGKPHLIEAADAKEQPGFPASSTTEPADSARRVCASTAEVAPQEPAPPTPYHAAKATLTCYAMRARYCVASSRNSRLSDPPTMNRRA